MSWFIELLHEKNIDRDGLTNILDIKKESVRNWKPKQVPPKHCLQIEKYSDGKIKAHDLNPSIFMSNCVFDHELIEIKKVAERLKISRVTLWKLRKASYFPAPIVDCRGKKLYSVQQINQAINNNL